MLSIGVYIKKRRRSLGVTQKELADRLRVEGAEYSPSTIGWWETDRAAPPVNEAKFLNALARALEVQPTDIMVAAGYFGEDAPKSYEDLSVAERKLIDAVRRGEIHEVFETLTALTKTV